MQSKWQEKHYLRTALVLVVIAAIGYAVWLFKQPRTNTAEAAQVVTAPVVAKVPTVQTPVKGGAVRTLKPAAKAKLKLPEPVIQNDDQQVTSAAVVAPSERKTTVTSVIDTKTGETTVFTKPEPYPWLAVESRGEARLDYGYKITRGEPVPRPVSRLSVTHNFIQVKALHVGVNAALDSDGSTFIGIGLSYRW